MSDQGTKFDQDKLRLDLVPPEVITALGTILTFGANKYGDRNWEKGIDLGRVYGALQRHLNAYWSGELIDPETGKSHLWHAACNIAFLITYEARGIKQETHPCRNEHINVNTQSFRDHVRRTIYMTEKKLREELAGCVSKSPSTSEVAPSIPSTMKGLDNSCCGKQRGTCGT